MIEYIFTRVIILSVCGALATVCLFALTPLSKRLFSEKWHYCSYVFALVIFLLPLSFTFEAKPQSTAEISTPKETQIIYVVEKSSGDKVSGSEVSSFEEAEQRINTTDKTAPVLTFSERIAANRNFMDLFEKLAFIWVFFAFFYFAFFATLHAVTVRRYKRNAQPFDTCYIHDTNLAVFKSKAVTSPTLTGIFKPKLFIPDTEMDNTDIKNILCHEAVHARRKDIAVKWLCLLVKSIHWFNPLVFTLSRQINLWCEVSCDVEATKSMSKSDAADYCETILSLITKKSKKSCPVLGAGSTKKTLERRFSAIMKEKKSGRKAAVISAIITGTLLICALTVSAIMGGKSENNKEIFTEKKDAVIEKGKTESDKLQEYKEKETKNTPVTVQDAESDKNNEEDCLVPTDDTTDITIQEQAFNSDDKHPTPIPLEEANNCDIKLIPVTSAKISAGFDKYRHPAVDFILPKGTVITCPIDGTVTAAEYAPDKGNYIEIQSFDGTTKLMFAHLSKMYVSSTDNIRSGDTIGEVGSTGMATGPHLHLEYHENGEATNPIGVFITAENGEILAIYSKPSRTTN